MTAEEIKQSIDSMKIHLSKEESAEYWMSFFSFLIPLGVFAFIVVYLPISNGEFPIYGTIFIIILFLLLVRYQLLSVKLDVYELDLNEEQFRQANEAAAILNGWIILSDSANYFTAIKETSGQWQGIKVTAIQNNGRLYLNSMPRPSIRSNPFTFGQNKKNKLALIRQYQLIIKGENVIEVACEIVAKRESEFWEESEWSIKNTLKRVLGYGLSLLFIVLAVMMITTGGFFEILLGLALIGLCLSYIYQDIQVIRKKRKRKIK